MVCLLGMTTSISAQSSYTLQQIKSAALEHNISIRSARLDLESASQQRKEAFTKYFPTISGTGAWFNANRGMAKMTLDPQTMMSPELGAVLAQSFPPEALASLATPTSISMMKNGTIASVTAMQPVFAGGQIVNGNRLARVGEEASMLQLRLSENEVEKTVSQYYWQLMALNEKQKTIAAVETLLSDIYKDVDVAVRAGVALRNDLLQVQLRQNEVESQKVKLQNGISVMKLLLEQYCGLNTTPEIVYPDISGKNLQLPTPLTGQGAVTPLPEYQLLQKQVEAAQLQKKMAVGQQLPSVAVGAGYNYHNLMENDRTFAMVFATVSVPISDWWGGSHAIKRKKIELQKAQDQLEDNAELLGIRIQKAWNDVNEAALQVDIARRSIEQAEENLRLNRNFYQAGTVKMSDLLEAQLLYQQACDQHVDAYANYQQQLLLYQQATGQKTSASR
jgi:outer membrane protein TolC